MEYSTLSVEMLWKILQFPNDGKIATYEGAMGEQNNRPRYPLLEGILAEKGISLKGTYTTRDVAEILDSSVSAIQRRIRSGRWKVRDLPGRARFVSQDLEDILQRVRNVSAEPAESEEDDE